MASEWLPVNNVLKHRDADFAIASPDHAPRCGSECYKPDDSEYGYNRSKPVESHLFSRSHG